MSLVLSNKITLWNPGAADIAPAADIDNGKHYWLSTANALVDADATNLPPTTALFSFNTDGADACCIVIGSKVLTVAPPATACTGLSHKMCAWGIPTGCPEEDILSIPPGLRASSANVASQHATNSLVVYTTSPLKSGIITQEDFASDVSEGIILIPDASNITAGDYMLATVWLGKRNQNFIDSIATNATANTDSKPNISGIDKIYLATKFVPTLGASLTELTLEAKMVALLFKEVQPVVLVNESSTVNKNRLININANA